MKRHHYHPLIEMAGDAQADQKTFAESSFSKPQKDFVVSLQIVVVHYLG